MIILWYADFAGSTKDLEKVNRLLADNVKKFGGSVDGPYYPQSNDLLYIFHVDSFEWLNKSGRVFLKRIQEEGISLTPTRYEVAVTPKEFWGK